MMDNPLDEQACSKCGRLVDRAAGVAAPVNNDVSICLYCGHATLFEDGRLRDFTPAELAALTDKDRDAIAKMQVLARLMRGDI